MSNYATLKAAIQSAVYTNGNNEITGAGLQAVLLQIVNTVGDGYVFKGVATAGTAPGTPDANVFYIGGAGTYTNFGSSYTVAEGSIGVFKYNGSWTKNSISTVGANSLNSPADTHIYTGLRYKGALHADGKIYGTHTTYITTDFVQIYEGEMVHIIDISYQSSPSSYPRVAFYSSPSESNFVSSMNREGNKYVAQADGYIRATYSDGGLGVFFSFNQDFSRSNTDKFTWMKYPFYVDNSKGTSLSGNYFTNQIYCREGDIIVGNIAPVWNAVTPMNKTGYDANRLQGYSGHTMGYVVPVAGIYQIGTTDNTDGIRVYRDWGYRHIDVIDCDYEVGCMHQDGVVYSNHTNYRTSDYIEVSAGDLFEIIGVEDLALPNYQLACSYDENKDFIQYLYLQASAGKQYILAYDDGYIRFSQNVNNNPSLKVYKVDCNGGVNSMTQDVVADVKQSVWRDRKVAFFGDSITAGGHYVNAYVGLSGCVAVNAGVSGTTIADVGEDGPMCERWDTDIPSDSELIVILGGVNDQHNGVPLGEFKYYNSDGSLNGTFYGALHTMLRGLKVKFPLVPIVIMTPMHNSFNNDTLYGDIAEYNKTELSNNDQLIANTFGENGGTMKDYVEAIKEVAEFYSIPVIDLYAISTIEPVLVNNNTTYTVDGLHPNAAGGERIAKVIYPYLEMLDY